MLSMKNTIAVLVISAAIIQVVEMKCWAVCACWHCRGKVPPKTRSLTDLYRENMIEKRTGTGNQCTFELMDTNNDGFVTWAEITAILVEYGEVKEFSKAAFVAMDKDGNGKVTRAEFNAVAPHLHQIEALSCI